MTARRTAIVVVGWAATILVAFAVAALRVMQEGRSELAGSDRALAEGDARGATSHARAAARAWVPFAPHVTAASARLRTIARDAEGRGETESALFAWRAIRSAAVSSRSFLSFHERQRQAADAAIARLEAAGPRASRPASSAAPESDDAPPRFVWGLVLVIGAVLWVVAAVRASTTPWIGHWPPRITLALAAGGLAFSWLALFFG